MRHQKNVIKLSMKAGPRQALLRGLATNFILHGKMKTTDKRAKTIRSIIEKYITVSKKNNLISRRKLLQYFYSEKAVNKLLNELGPKYLDRKGGYTRVIKLADRKGDRAPVSLIELI